MGWKKKKNVIIITLCMAVSFILYQLYFFLTITSESNNRSIRPVKNYDQIQEIAHLRSEADVHINYNGIIKGVYYTNMPKYRPDGHNHFKCLKSGQKIPFESVNDDYCDCDDGSDEPSTSACVNGKFYCDTQYHKKPISLLAVPSSRVNDGICDCCDGSDEWLSEGKLLSQSNSKHYRFYVTKCPVNCKL